MLTSGYLGETKQVERNLSLFIGFVFFYVIWIYLLQILIQKRNF